MSTLSAREKLDANQITYSLLFQKFETLQAKDAVLNEDPTAVTSAAALAFLAEFDAFADEYNAFLGNSRALTQEINALTVPGAPGSLTRETNDRIKANLVAKDQQFNNQVQNTLINTLRPFRAALRENTVRITREETEQANADLTTRAENIVDYRAEQNSDGSGPGDQGTWYVVGESGEIDSSGLTEQAARLRAEELSFGDEDADLTVGRPEDQPDANLFRAVFNDGTGPGTVGTWYVLGPGGQIPLSGTSQARAEALADQLNSEQLAAAEAAAREAAITPEQRAAAAQAALETRLREQAARAEQRRQANKGDWRVKLRLAENANYLYRDPDIDQQGILWPLAITNGVIFPYTPTINTSYNASYTDQTLTHSNYKGYFYQSSHVGQISIQAEFTAQDTNEANYMLAAIHFFRSATKMFYGQDAQRGAPPPLVFLQGLGEMQFNLHPCVISAFQYNLPANVDYIRARTANIAGTAQDSLLFRRARQSTSNPYNASNQRLNNAGLQSGARTTLPGPGTLGVGTDLQGPTYVPTKLSMDITLLPMQTRTQQSQQFSVKDFANGNLQRGGFW